MQLLTAVTLLLLAAATAPDAQPRKTVAQLGFLGSSTFERQRHLVAALQQALRELGYVEGQNVVLLKGASPGDLPIEQPTKFELVINIKTSKTLGLTIAQSLRLRANQMLE
jgi:ABC-type uncharacterized transport system substrate-binding protein